MSTIESICVYCASGPGNNPAFMDAARKLGRILAENGIRLVYGGGSVGLMGALAESVIDHGGVVTGVARMPSSRFRAASGRSKSWSSS